MQILLIPSTVSGIYKTHISKIKASSAPQAASITDINSREQKNLCSPISVNWNTPLIFAPVDRLSTNGIIHCKDFFTGILRLQMLTAFSVPFFRRTVTLSPLIFTIRTFSDVPLILIFSPVFMFLFFKFKNNITFIYPLRNVARDSWFTKNHFKIAPITAQIRSLSLKNTPVYFNCVLVI